MKKRASTAPGNPLTHKAISAGLLTVVVVGLGILFWPSRPAPQPAAGPVDTNPPAPQLSEASGPAAEDFQPLLGRWFREDGGYRLELMRAGADGRIEAAYFNPRPIKVSYAAATNDSGTTRIRVELNDVGYPGCVYSLVHDRTNDRLIGTYFQAAVRETYEVMFVRMP